MDMDGCNELQSKNVDNIVYNISCDWRLYVAPVCCGQIVGNMHVCIIAIRHIPVNTSACGECKKIEEIILSQ